MDVHFIHKTKGEYGDSDVTSQKFLVPWGVVFLFQSNIQTNTQKIAQVPMLIKYTWMTMLVSSKTPAIKCQMRAKENRNQKEKLQVHLHALDELSSFLPVNWLMPQENTQIFGGFDFSLYFFDSIANLFLWWATLTCSSVERRLLSLESKLYRFILIFMLQQMFNYRLIFSVGIRSLSIYWEQKYRTLPLFLFFFFNVKCLPRIFQVHHKGL